MKTPRLLIPFLATLVATRFEAGNHEVTTTLVKVRGVWPLDSVK